MSSTLKTELTAQEAFNSLNYYEIQEMKKSFGISMSQLEELAVEAMYALVWVIERRTSTTVDINMVKSLPFGEVGDYFADEDPGDVEGKEPTTVSES